MASSSRRPHIGSGSGGGYDIPSSIVSLPTRLQRKIQKETQECQPNNAENRSELTNSVKIKEKSEARLLTKNDKRVGEEEQRRNRDNICLGNFSISMQSPQRNCRNSYQQQGLDRGRGGENAIKITTSSTVFPSSSTILLKERSQHSLKECCSAPSLRKGSGTGYSHLTIGTGGGTFNPTEPPSWFKNYEILEKNDYWRQKIQDLSNLHSKYFELFENDDKILQNWSNIMKYRTAMNEIFTKILECNLKFCCKENVEMYFWKILNYNLIEWLRRNIQQLQQHNGGGGGVGQANVKMKDLKMKAIQLIHDAVQFYDEKLKFLEHKYFHQNSTTTTNYNQKYELLAKILKQKILIHLGDLYRYKEQIENRNNFHVAKNYYEMAQRLVPSNGIPYNQLAIISIYYKRIFDAIYYYMRSLCASNPIYSAKESLKELFDEIRKKHEDNFTGSCGSGRQPVNKSPSSGKKLNLPLKKEIWIHPNGSKRLHSFGSFTAKQLQYCFEEQLQLNSLNSDDELLKRFTSNYLYLLGKLFTGIGMENFQKILHEILIEFKLLIFHNTLQFSKTRLLQIIALNIFVIEYNRQKLKQNDEINENSTGYNTNENGFGEAKEMIICNHAFNTSSLLFGIILNRCNEILKELLTDNNSETDELSPSSSAVLKLCNSEDHTKERKEFRRSKYAKRKINIEEISIEIKLLLQAIKIWCDWLEKNLNFWNPPKKFPSAMENLNFLNDYEIINPWNGLAQLTTLLSCFDFENIDENQSKTQLNNLKLMEDNYFNGFLPLNNTAALDNVEEHENNVTPVSDEKLEMIKRFQHIKRFSLEILCNSQPPVFEKVLDADGAIVYIKSVIKECDNLNNDALESFENFDEDTDCSEEEISVPYSSTTIENQSNIVEEDTNESDVLELIKRKQELEEKTKLRQKYQQKLENLLENSETIFHIEVRPKYLIPDTNCFIDFLDLLKTIALNSKRYILAIPIVVCNELEGLSKGFKISSISTLQATSSTIRHFDEVTIRAREALDFIKCKKYSSIKYVTTKGSILNTSNFIVEENDDDCELNGIGGGEASGGRRREHSTNSNDDRILQTAVNLCNRTNIERKLKEKIFIQTECVLLTTDRNLRVKALSRNLSVSQLKEFISWAKIYEN